MIGSDRAKAPVRVAQYEIRLATEADKPAICRFNDRLKQNGISYQLPLDLSLPGELRDPPTGFPIFRETVIAIEDDELRAGLLLYHDSIRIAGDERPFCWLQLPISEGLIDPRYGSAFIMLLSYVLKREPCLIALGIGSLDETFSKVLLALRWRHATVPFVFLPRRVGRVLSGLRYLRERGGFLAVVGGRVLRLAGVAAAGAGTLAVIRLLNRRHLRHIQVTSELEFGSWADEVYLAAREEYGGAVARSARALNIRFPRLDERYVRLRLRTSVGQQELGWIVVTSFRMRGNKYFGDLHVGTLVDGFCRLRDIPTLVAAGLRQLSQQGVDIVVANWSHPAWVAACRKSGFLAGPSNYFLFGSPGSRPLLENTCPLDQLHMTRGDGDGPGHLLPPPLRSIHQRSAPTGG